MEEKIFPNLELLRKWMQEIDYPLRVIDNVILHEEAHAKMAISLGYHCNFGYEVWPQGYYFKTIIKGRKIPLRDLVRIAMAPECPGEDDLNILEIAISNNEISKEGALKLLK